MLYLNRHVMSPLEFPVFSGTFSTLDFMGWKRTLRQRFSNSSGPRSPFSASIRFLWLRTHVFAGMNTVSGG